MKGYLRPNPDVLSDRIQETEKEVPLRIYVGVIYLVIGLILYLCTS